MRRHLDFYNANAVFEYYYDLIKEKGSEYGNTKAIFNELIKINKPSDKIITTPFRKWNETYVKREWEWYLSGNRSVKEIKKYAPIWDRMHDGNNLVWSNYGWWWQVGQQLERVISMLKDDPFTRRAIVVHYNPNHVWAYEYDTPCNLVLNFYILDDKLELTVMARSIDLWYGFCNDQWIFATLLEKIALAVNKEVGSLYYFITNLHIYKQQL
jgi:thymidylate synthase